MHHPATGRTLCVTTEDGHELTIQVNHLAPFLLTALLLPSLAALLGDEESVLLPRPLEQEREPVVEQVEEIPEREVLLARSAVGVVVSAGRGECRAIDKFPPSWRSV